jgi:hypothetical protein
MSQTLERLAELYYQQFSSGYASLCRPFNEKAVPGQLESELEVSEEYVTLSKEVAAYYKPLVERLVEAGVLTVTVMNNRSLSICQLDPIEAERLALLFTCRQNLK